MRIAALGGMSIEALLIFLLVGAVAGFIAAKITQGVGLGLLVNMAVGVIGAFVGSWLLGLAGVRWGGWLGMLVTATLGAIALLAIVSLFTSRRRRII